MAARHISVREAQNNLPELAKLLSTTRQQVVVEVPETRGLALISAEHLFALEETLEVMCDSDHMERIKAGEEALASGNFVSQGQFEQEMGISTRTMPTRWRLVVSGPARRAILSLPNETSRPRVVEFLTGDLAESPGDVGVELEGQLSRRYVASVADQRVVYRLDPTNRAVRVVDVQRGERVFLGQIAVVMRGVPAEPKLLRATSADIPTLVEALVRAFEDDPVASFMFCDDSRRPNALRKFFTIQLSRDYLQNGEVWTNEERSGVAIWGPPTKPRPGMRDLFRVFPLVRELMPLSHMRLALRGLFAVETERPKMPHWYLATLGTDPVAQHHGVGSALLTKTLAHIDQEGMPTYLECSKAQNVSFYSRFGFKVTKEMRAVESGPLIWLMWRDPRPPE